MMLNVKLCDIKWSLLPDLGCFYIMSVYKVDRWTIKTQFYKIMIHSATCFDPMGSPPG